MFVITKKKLGSTRLCPPVGCSGAFISLFALQQSSNASIWPSKRKDTCIVHYTPPHQHQLIPMCSVPFRLVSSRLVRRSCHTSNPLLSIQPLRTHPFLLDFARFRFVSLSRVFPSFWEFIVVRWVRSCPFAFSTFSETRCVKISLARSRPLLAAELTLALPSPSLGHSPHGWVQGRLGRRGPEQSISNITETWLDVSMGSKRKGVDGRDVDLNLRELLSQSLYPLHTSQDRDHFD